MIFAPIVDGTTPLRTPAPVSLEGFQRRVAAGHLTGWPHPRSVYIVTQGGPAHLQVRAADWWTALNVGLNQLDLRVPDAGVVQYRVRYWRWASYALGLSGGIGAIGLILLFLTDVRSYIARNPSHMIPGFSVDQNLAVAWGMVLFWGFVWPWLLIALHRRPVRRLVECLIGEVDAAVQVGSPERAV